FPTSDSPLIGASGAAAGIVAAYLILHPKMQVWVLFLSKIPLRLPAWTVLGAWIAFQVFMFATDPDGQVSWAAHVGGALAGALLVFVLKRRSIPLFDRELVVPEAVELDPNEALPPKVNAPHSWGRNAASST
ncbi:MAG: rhomboid family intramembrane serine protease, partial [Pseudomonadota bacterium]